MATHSRVLAWRIPGTEETGGLSSMGSQSQTLLKWLSSSSSSLLWFMELTFQVPMQYCSLQHGTLLLSPVPFRTGCCVCFGSIPSFFLELFLLWSPVADWGPIDLGSLSFSVLSFLPFHTVHGVLKARILKWLAIPFSSGPCFVRTLHHDPSFLGVWSTMDGSSWHCTGGSDKDHPQEKRNAKRKNGCLRRPYK